ncbi:hypothetical protein V1511DRAFT_449401, partial [Dipodascopsis uninucleata]
DYLPLQNDGSDKFFGMENFGYTCYCNSVLQCLYYSRPFRELVLSYPPKQNSRTRRTSVHGSSPHPFLSALKAAMDKDAQEQAAAKSAEAENKKRGSLRSKKGNAPLPTAVQAVGASVSVGNQTAGSPHPSHSLSPAALAAVMNSNPPPPNALPAHGDEMLTPEQKKKAALTTGPIINLDHSLHESYGMDESLYTALKDLFESMVENKSRTGIVSPAKLIEVLKRQNELFRSSMHQDAHEFFNFLLNEIIDNIEHYDRQVRQITASDTNENLTIPDSRWVHELFEGLLTSETKCLTCENVSRRDEQFIDLSIDLEKHTSVTSCLRQFSASEMLCESNKFHCDCCGGLQEAEKRMKIKKLPRILALHLKRFKFTEDMQRNVKLFHKVVFPFHLRLFNTTDDVQNPDKLYELYAVVVHIGGGPYHGHYVSIVKTEHTGWILYDDEMVERVDDDYVTNFFGDKPGLACAYILFYQEIGEDKYESSR